MDDYFTIGKKDYKKSWGVNLKKDFVVIKQHMKNGKETYTPQKTFASQKEANRWILKKKKR